eukprot:s858_g15.t1
MGAQGEYAAVAKSLGCSDADWARYFSGQFNRRTGKLHFCDGSPCVVVEDYNLHVTRLKLFTVGGFARPYMSHYIKKQMEKWEKEELDAVGEDETDLTGTGREDEDEELEEHREEEAGVEEDPPEKEKTKASVKKPKEEGAPKKAKILKTGLEVGAGQGAVQPAGAGDPREPCFSPGYSPSALDERQKELEGGGRPEIEDKKKRKKEPSRSPVGRGRSRSRKRRNKREGDKESEREDTRGTTSRNLQVQLLRQAAETVKQKEEKKREEKKRNAKRDPGAQLAKILTAVVRRPRKGEGGSEDDPDQPDQKKKKKDKKKKSQRRRKKKGLGGAGDPSSPGSSDDTSQTTSSSRGYGRHSGRSSSSEDEKKLEAPLKRKSQERPGSVLEMLVNHARAQLDQNAKVAIGSEESVTLTKGVKIGSYFAIVVRPQLGNAMPQLREMHTLAQCVDLLRQGDLALLGDVLAGRFVSLHQAVLDGGWSTARHLELMPLEEGSAAGPAVVLQAKKHARMAAKLQPGETWSWQGGSKGRGGRGRGSGWNDNQHEGKGKGKKGPKGKNKGKHWGQTEKEVETRQKEKVPEK